MKEVSCALSMLNPCKLWFFCCCPFCFFTSLGKRCFFTCGQVSSFRTPVHFLSLSLVLSCYFSPFFPILPLRPQSTFSKHCRATILLVTFLPTNFTVNRIVSYICMGMFINVILQEWKNNFETNLIVIIFCISLYCLF